MRPVAILSLSALAALTLICFTGLAICGACSLSNYIEARRDLEQKEQTERVIKVMSDMADKIPEFRLLNRKKKSDPASNYPRVDRLFGR